MIDETHETEIVTDALATIERAQVDIQISTARKYPRTLSKVKERMLSFATLDEETAASCFYTLPARRGGDDKPIQGPSVRMAEIALASYQHVKAGARIIGDDGKFITAQAVVHDLENNVAVSIEVRRRVTNRSGQRFSDDMIAVTGNAACAIALRNAVFRVVPRALINPVYETAKRVAVGDVRSLTAKRADVVARLKKMGAKEDRILAAVQAEKIEDIDLSRLEILIGLGTAIKDGEITLEDAFPAAGQPEQGRPIFTKPNESQTEAVKQIAAPAEKLVTTNAKEPEKVVVEKPAEPDQSTVQSTVEKASNASDQSRQARLSEQVIAAGFDLDTFNRWAVDARFLAAEVGNWSEIPDNLADRCLKGIRGLITQLKGVTK